MKRRLFNNPLENLRHNHLEKRTMPVTVCIAAICENDIIVCASDSMLTHGIIKFERPQTKLVQLTDSICLLFAGDVAMQSEICPRVGKEINALEKRNPSDCWKIRDVADIYAKHYNELSRKKIEQAILEPRGLNFDTYFRIQREMAPDLVLKIDSEIRDYEIAGVETIIAGRDNTGAHIYAIYNGNIICKDYIGFASIGIGWEQASLQFVLARHTSFSKFLHTVLLVYSAKKRSEVVHGVGEDTDMFIIGPQFGMIHLVTSKEMGILDAQYKYVRESEDSATKVAEAEVAKNFTFASALENFVPNS